MNKFARVLISVFLFLYLGAAEIFAQTDSKLPLSFIEGSPNYPGEDWSNATDGDIQGWEGTVTTKGNPPYAIFDLGRIATVDRVRLLTDTGVGYDTRWLRDFRIQVSTTGTSLDDFSTVLSASKTVGSWETFSLPPTSARYIKLIIDNLPAPDGWHQLGEIEVYGLGVPIRDADLDDDGDVDIFDYSMLVENFGNASCGNIADIDGNCKVDIFDYNILVTNFGTSATPTPSPPRPSPTPPIDSRRGHTYPRSAVFVWCCQLPEYYAKFDLVISRPRDADIIAQAKQLNPSMLWLPTEDLNTINVDFTDITDQWHLVDSKGNAITLGALYGGDPMSDLSDLGVRVNGQRLIDFIPEYFAKLIQDTGADGFASDGLYYRGHVGWYGWDDIDLDRNGVNDNVEHGKDWVTDHWGDGVDFMLTKLRQLLGPDKFIVINTGSSDLPTPSAINGIYIEHAPSIWGDYERRLFTSHFGSVVRPPVFVLNYYAGPEDAGGVRPTYTNFFPFVRMGLARAMLEGEGEYYDVNAWETGEHYFSEYIDEFDLDVGYPKGDAQQIASGVWARIFDHGAVIGSFNDHLVTVTDQQLRSAPGYSGPYWRFEGCQDPSHNSGQQFDALTLQGYGYIGYGDSVQTVGDGIVLVGRDNVTACPDIPRPEGGYWRE